MGSLSKFLLIAFEITNELYTALGAGVLGMVVLLKHGFQNHQCVKTLSVVAFTAGCWVYINREHESLKPSKKKVVCITGCDSGLGFSLAQHAVQMGFTVIAGFLSLDSKGCKEIKQLFGSNIIQIQLDITDSSSVQASVQTLEHFLGRNPGYSRVITITSHCAQTTLPGLSVYGATKSALAAWSDAFRIEMNKYSVDVLTFIPGSFTTQSNIMARQLQNVQEMHDSFSPEQHSFYSDYFKAFNMYLSFLTPPPKPVKIDDEPMYRVFERTLLDKYPDVIYKHEPLRYWFYHLLFKISPRHLRDYFIKKFLQMPEYVPAESKDSEDDIDDIDV
ncbi:SDR family oxidoreductase shroud isoform X2 [Leptinotarsa decemlineata]|uniref:SDR family oxidoreductase shroud isoform X2 n=1 Tax=Leptinotarsa decemlineata TaxID=7539 RepID=UPI000C251ADF|nr:estradiol 17-beta-dehydrogenase 2 isoform X2 [Leptinotarsa decemlineata]